jgi:hypothetical protein
MKRNAVLLSKALRWIFSAGFLLIPALTVLIFLNLDWMLQQAAAQGALPGIPLSSIPSPVPLGSKLLGFAIACVPTALTCALLWHLAALFGGYARGEVFTAASVGRIRRVGVLLLARELLDPFVGAGLSVALTMTNPPGQRVLAFNFDSSNLTTIVAALTVIMAAYVMDQARELHDESQLTI